MDNPMPTVGPYANKLSDIQFIFQRVLNIATSLAGVAIFIMLIVGAFQFLTAGSNKEQMQKASGTITAALLGGAGLILIWLIFQFIANFTGVQNILQPEIMIVTPAP